MTPVTRSTFIRATVTGERRSVDVALPVDEPIALLIPQLLDLLAEPATSQQMRLVTSVGVVLDPAEPLSRSEIVDGVRLRLMPAGETPPAPVVTDLAETVEQARGPGGWDRSSRAITLAVVGGLACAVAVVLGFATVPQFAGMPALAVTVAWFAGSAAAAAARAPGMAWLTALLGLFTGALAIANTRADGISLFLLGTTLAFAGLLALGWCTGRLVAGVAGAFTLEALSALAVAGWLLTGEPARTATVVAVVVLIAIGTAPRLALAVAGLFELDHRMAGGEEVATAAATEAVASAEAILTGAVLGASLVLGTATGVLAGSGRLEPWPTATTILVCAAFALRGRHFPLAVHRGATWAAALVGPMALVAATCERWPAAAAGVVAAAAGTGLVIAAAGLVLPTPVQRARLRRWGDVAETTLILATVPTAVGVFGLYSQLLETFG